MDKFTKLLIIAVVGAVLIVVGFLTLPAGLIFNAVGGFMLGYGGMGMILESQE